MARAQLDLFSGPGRPVDRAPPSGGPPPKPPAGYDDRGLLAALADAGLAEGPELAREAGRRGLAEAVPILEAVCRRFAGFGWAHPVPEQAAALEALAAIGGRAAAGAVERLMARRAVEGPTLAVALSAAARLGAVLPSPVLVPLLAHDDPAVRSGACRCVGRAAAAPVTAALVALLEDLHASVSAAAACALGRSGRTEARAELMRLLSAAPGPEVIEALAGVADEDCLVLLGRVARERRELAPAVLDALEAFDQPIADRIRATLLASGAAAPG